MLAVVKQVLNDKSCFDFVKFERNEIYSDG